MMHMNEAEGRHRDIHTVGTFGACFTLPFHHTLSHSSGKQQVLKYSRWIFRFLQVDFNLMQCTVSTIAYKQTHLCYLLFFFLSSSRS